MQNGIATLEDTSAVCYKIKHTLTIDKPYSYHKIQYPHSWYLSKRVQNLSIHIVLNKDVSSGLIHNHQILEATKMSFKG